MKQEINLHKNEFLEELMEFLRIPSISALLEYKNEVNRGAEWLKASLIKAGLENAEVIETDGHPIVYADWLHAEGQQTVLVYGHYDVQPADPLELWDTSPFDPVIRDEKIFARGATDDKGQLFIHLKAVELLMEKHGTLPVNIKFCIEGEEEIASPNLAPFIHEQTDKLAADTVLISDTSFIEKGLPAICTSLRGALALELQLETANTDLHSGSYGGGVPNAVHSLVRLLNSFHNEKGEVAVENFYKGVPELTDELREEVGNIPFDEEKTKRELGLDALYGEEGFSFQERTGIRPTLEINGIGGGFQGEGLKTIVPSKSEAKISCRLVGDQDPQEIYRLIEKHIEVNTPVGSRVSLNQLVHANPVSIDSTHPDLQKAADAYEKVYGVRPLFPKEGGSIPIVEVFARVLGAPVVLMGFGLNSENLHAPNEHFHIENFTNGIETVCEYLQSL
ncbi:dipeptidase [Halobacillus campisalis]|uniref:Dipeptidase n=1 Tax=Halobacillus campisalis TaxID=435909 RepID=A0ABW2K0E0_9BACI|nr:dipeptidase [Halobacillus campisalis]